MEKDPVCGMLVDPLEAAAERRVQQHVYYFCSPRCAVRFDLDPLRYVGAPPTPGVQSDGSR